MKKETKPELLAVLLLSVLLITFITLSILQYLNDSSSPAISELFKFKSDLDSGKGSSSIYKESLAREEIYIAYSSYSVLTPGEYTVTFYFRCPGDIRSKCRIDIVSSKGRNIEVSSEELIVSGISDHSLFLRLSETKEVEPRVRQMDNSRNIEVEKITFQRTAYLFPFKKILFRTLYLTPMFYFALISFLFAFTDEKKWKLALACFLTYTGIFLIVKFAWMSEDALITLKHVDNFLAGNGLVFNAGERVEGYTHTLWFYIISFLRSIGLSPKGSLILPGILFSSLSLYLLFFRIWRIPDKYLPLNFGGALLIGMSAFIDFGTSGLETSLSYMLLILFSIQLEGDGWREKPVLFGITITMMTFNRPDFGIFLVFGLLIYLYGYLRKQIKSGTVLRFISPPFLLLSVYEIFRMGYYGALFPNPFYAKSGGSSYFSQGFLYLIDLLKGSTLILILILAGLIFFVKKGRRANDLKGRSLIISAGIFYAFFIIRGGGDFMHARFLLPVVILIAISSSGAFDFIFDKKKVLRLTGTILIILAVLVSRSVIPVQKRGGFVHNHGISDERFTFYGNKIFPLTNIFKDEHIFMWKTIGKNYRFLSEKARKKIKVAYHTVGFIGYYAGSRVNVVDRLGLTDPVVARKEILKRGRPGHEKSAPFGYLIYRKLTFGETPFKIWNDLAKTRFGVIWDISRNTLAKFSFFLDKDFKPDLDSGIVSFIEKLDTKGVKENSDLLYFLEEFWYPNATPGDKIIFESKYDHEMIRKHSESYDWIEKNKKKIKKWDSVIKGKLTMKRFFSNILFALKNL